MRLLLDDQTLPLPEPTFAAAMDAGRREAERRGRVVVEVRVDGRLAPESWLDEPHAEGRRASEVRLVSADPVSLVQATLHEVADALENAREAQRHTAELIHEDRLEEAMAPLAEAISAWSNLQQAVSHGAALLGLDVQALEAAADRPFGDMINDLAERLRQTKQAIQDEDWTTVADLFGYDMDERSDAWQEAIHALAANIGHGRG